jgi:hypothetical protein
MQKPIEGLSVLAVSATKSILKPSRRDLLELYIVPLYKGAIVFSEHKRAQPPQNSSTEANSEII